MAADSDAEEVVQVTASATRPGARTHQPQRAQGIAGRGGSGSGRGRARYGAGASQEDGPQRLEVDIVSLCARAIAALVMLTLTSLITAVFVLMVMRELTPLSLN